MYLVGVVVNNALWTRLILVSARLTNLSFQIAIKDIVRNDP